MRRNSHSLVMPVQAGIKVHGESSDSTDLHRVATMDRPIQSRSGWIEEFPPAPRLSTTNGEWYFDGKKETRRTCLHLAEQRRRAA